MSAQTAGLADIHPCDHPATIKLTAYLRSTAVPAFASELQARHLLAHRATVLTRQDLGQLLSIFANLGGIASMQETGHLTYLIRDVQAVLAQPGCTDTDSRTRLAGLIESVRVGRLTDRILTAARTDVGVVFVDGNKRAVAIYEAGEPTPVRLPIYLLEATRGVLSLPGLLAGRITYL